MSHIPQPARAKAPTSAAVGRVEVRKAWRIDITDHINREGCYWNQIGGRPSGERIVEVRVSWLDGVW